MKKAVLPPTAEAPITDKLRDAASDGGIFGSALVVAGAVYYADTGGWMYCLDANTGQNAIRQAEEFTKTAGVTGLVLTKIDGTARGGALIGVYDQLKVPIKFLGTGEKVTDLKDFIRHPVDSLGDGPTVQRFERDDLEDQQIQCALDEISGLAHHPSLSY